MKYRIAIWATAGFLIVGFWALFARVFPILERTNPRLVDSRECYLPDCDRRHASPNQSVRSLGRKYCDLRVHRRARGISPKEKE